MHPISQVQKNLSCKRHRGFRRERGEPQLRTMQPGNMKIVFLGTLLPGSLKNILLMTMQPLNVKDLQTSGVLKEAVSQLRPCHQLEVSPWPGGSHQLEALPLPGH